ncbi:MAG TPA: glycosyltransferase [Chloroflexota bacterium]
MRLALVHDYLNQYGGAERVLEVLHDLYPQSPIYTSIYDPSSMPDSYRTWDIRTSFMQRIPFALRLGLRFQQSLLLLYPAAFESFDFSDYDVVLSVSSAWAKGVKTRPGTLNICYCLAPMRFAWNYQSYADREQLPGPIRKALPAAMAYLRRWDYANSQKVNRLIGISSTVVKRIGDCYQRSADLIFPPVETEAISLGSGPGDGYLVLSRLVPYKRIDLAVAACSRLGLPLTVIGDGRERAPLEAIAGPTVRFLGRVSDAEAREALGRCRAFLFPGEEDFGITPVEAMAAGRPVVAYASGGALDTVREGETGQLFHPQTVDALAAQLAVFDPGQFDSSKLRAHAERFSREHFQEAIAAYVDTAWQAHQGQVTV